MKTEIRTVENKVFEFPCLMKLKAFPKIVVFFVSVRCGTCLSLDNKYWGNYSLGEYRTDWITENFVCLESSESVILTNS